MKFVSWISKEMFPFRAKCFTVEIFSSMGWGVHLRFSFENRISFTFFYFSLHKIIADTMIGQICHTNKVSDTVYCLETVRLRNSQNMKLLSIKNVIFVLVTLPSPHLLTNGWASVGLPNHLQVSRGQPPVITWPSTSFSPASPHVYTRLLLSSFIAGGHNGVPAVSDAEDDSVVALKGVDDVTCDPIPDNHLPKHSPGQNCHAPASGQCRRPL